jgi:hypothetical protein
MIRFLATIVMTIGISLLIAQFSPTAATFLAPVTLVASFVLYGRLRRNRLEARGTCPACRGKRTQPAYEQGIYGTTRTYPDANCGVCCGTGLTKERDAELGRIELERSNWTA